MPFVRIGRTNATGYEASGGWDGSTHEFSIHVFTDTVDDVQARGIAKVIVDAMGAFEESDALTFRISDYEWLTTQMLTIAEEPATRRAVCDFRVTAIQ